MTNIRSDFIRRILENDKLRETIVQFMIVAVKLLFIESFPQMCFAGKWLQNRLRADKNELRSLLAVDIQGYQRGGFCCQAKRRLRSFTE